MGAAAAAAAPSGTTAYGRVGPAPDKNVFDAYKPNAAASSLPDNISYEYLFGPIENQGQTPCCVTFATSAVIEALLHKHRGEQLAVSKRALYSIAKHKYEPQYLTRDGLYEDSALRVFRDIGHVFENDYPFGKPTPPELIALVPEDLIHAVEDLKTYLRVDSDADHMMAALHEHGPLVIGMPWHKEWEDVGSDGIMSPDLQGNHVEGGHCTVIVGYSKAKGAFRLRNSWGTGWGDHGYAWLPMSKAATIDDVYVVSV